MSKRLRLIKIILCIFLVASCCSIFVGCEKDNEDKRNLNSSNNSERLNISDNADNDMSIDFDDIEKTDKEKDNDNDKSEYSSDIVIENQDNNSSLNPNTDSMFSSTFNDGNSDIDGVSSDNNISSNKNNLDIDDDNKTEFGKIY